MTQNQKSNSILAPIITGIVVGLAVATTRPWWIDFVSQLFKPDSLPLQTGTYQLGSNYIFIYRKEDRFCLWDSYIQEHTIASVFEDHLNPNIYRVHGYGDVSLIQKNYESIVFKGYEYLFFREFGFPEPNDEDVQRCLESSYPFYEHYPYQD